MHQTAVSLLTGAATLFVSGAALAGGFYDGPVTVVETGIEVDLSSEARISESHLLRNGGSEATFFDLRYLLPDRSAVVTGDPSPGPLSLGPGEDGSVGLTYVAPIIPAPMRALMLRPRLRLDDRLAGNAVERYGITVRLPPGVPGLTAATHPPVSVGSEDGRTVLRWLFFERVLTGVVIKWTESGVQLSVEKTATQVRTTYDQPVDVLVTVRNDSSHVVGEITLVETFGADELTPLAPLQEFSAVGDWNGRGYEWRKTVGALAPGAEASFGYRVQLATVSDAALGATTALAGGAPVAYSNRPVVTSVICGNGTCDEAETTASCAYDCPDPSDSDRDGVADSGDNCPVNWNPNQADLDGDGAGDACDADADADGIGWDDNCPFLANPGQEDTDADGAGDDCDDCPGGGCPEDHDGDGVEDQPDNCTTIHNPGQEDVDGDGAGDLCDPDADDDGLWAADEAILGTDPLAFDTDGDGVSDGDEVRAGTDPLAVDSDQDGLPDGADPDLFASRLGGYLCVRGDLEVSNNASLQTPGAMVVTGSLAIDNNAGVTAETVFLGCDAVVGNNATLDADLTYGGGLSVRTNATLLGDQQWAPCDLCGNGLLATTCDQRFSVAGLEAFAAQSIDRSSQALTPHLPPGSLDSEGNLELTNDAAVTLPGEVFAVRSLRLANNTSLVTHGETAVVVVLEDFELSNNVTIGGSGGDLVLVALSDGAIELGNNVDAEVTLVAPRAELVMLANNVRFFGALNVGRLVMSNNNELTIDGAGFSEPQIRWCY